MHIQWWLYRILCSGASRILKRGVPVCTWSLHLAKRNKARETRPLGSLGSISRVGRPTAKSCHCVWTLAEFKGVAPLRSAVGLARLGHTGARTLATGGRAPLVQVSMRISVVDRESGAKQSWSRTAQHRFCISTELRTSPRRSSCAWVCRKWLTLRYGMPSEPTWKAAKFQNFLGV